MYGIHCFCLAGRSARMKVCDDDIMYPLPFHHNCEKNRAIYFYTVDIINSEYPGFVEFFKYESDHSVNDIRPHLNALFHKYEEIILYQSYLDFSFSISKRN